MEWRNSSTILDLRSRCRWVDSFTPQPLYPWGKLPLVPTGQEAGWNLEPAWMLQNREKSCHCWELNPGIQPIAHHYTDWCIPALCVCVCVCVCMRVHMPMHKHTHSFLSWPSKNNRKLLRFSWTISHVNVELKTSVSVSLISTTRVDVVNDRMLLTFIPV
jgi:hypothetical protein